MGQSNCGRPAAAFAMMLLGLPPAFAMDRDAGGAARAAEVIAVPGLDSEAALAGRPCPTRFDYVVLASFADSPSLLSLSTYHFRSEVRFSTIPLAGLLRVDYQESAAGDCRSRGFRRQSG
jgi:hypothetical protein